MQCIRSVRFPRSRLLTSAFVECDRASAPGRELHFGAWWRPAPCCWLRDNAARPATAEPGGRAGLAKLHLSLLRHFQCVVHLDPEVTNRALKLGVAEQEFEQPGGSWSDDRSVSAWFDASSACRRLSNPA